MKVLVCVDLTPLSERVAQEAASLASMSGASLDLVHVVRCAPMPDSDRLEAPADLEYRVAEIEAMAARVRSSGAEAQGRVITCREPVQERLLGEVARTAADLVLVGTHDRGKTYELFIGSVTQAILSESPVPVVVVNGRRNGG